MKEITIRPIGVVRSTRKKAEDDNWDSEKVFVEVEPSNCWFNHRDDLPVQRQYEARPKLD